MELGNESFGSKVSGDRMRKSSMMPMSNFPGAVLLGGRETESLLPPLVVCAETPIAYGKAVGENLGPQSAMQQGSTLPDNSLGMEQGN